MSRGVHTHLKIGEKPDRFADEGSGKMQAAALCGNDWGFHYFTEDIDLVNCPACSKKWGMRKAKELGAKFAMEVVEKPTHKLRFQFRFLVDGEVYATLDKERGRHARWQVVTVEGDGLLTYSKQATTKEQAAVSAWIAFKDGKLKSRKQYHAEIAASNQSWREKEDARKAKEKVLETEFDTTLANLIEARDTAQTKMSNAEVAAISDAISLLQKIKTTPRLYNRVTSVED